MFILLFETWCNQCADFCVDIRTASQTPWKAEATEQYYTLVGYMIKICIKGREIILLGKLLGSLSMMFLGLLWPPELQHSVLLGSCSARLSSTSPLATLYCSAIRRTSSADRGIGSPKPKTKLCICITCEWLL